MIEEYLKKLNDEQEKPVYDTEGQVLVIAGAGSGKTRVLTTRIGYLVEKKGVSPERILAITFTNKAANEMKERLTDMGIPTDGMWVSTIHSMCVRILRMEGRRLGYEQNFSIYSEQDREHTIKRILENAGVVSDEKDDKLFKKVKFHIQNAKMQGLSPRRYAEENADTDNVAEICRYYQLYEDELSKSNSMDFDDLLVKAEMLLAEYPEVRERFANRFLYVHVDEFQDTNGVQYRLVKHLCSVHNNLFVVGDDDQSIYGWRGAEIENILGFPKDFPNAKVYKLQRNYRSTKKILELANCVIKGNRNRNEKELWTENPAGSDVDVYVGKDEGDEARFVASKIRQAIDYFDFSPKDFAVLMRINALSRSVEHEFASYNIPYKVYGGFKFYERKEIKDLTAYLRIVSNPLDNEAVARVINVPKRGIGDGTVQTLLQYAEENGFSLFDAIMEAENTDLNSGAKKKVTEFYRLIRSLMMQSQEALPVLVKSVIDRTAFNAQFEADTEDNLERRQNVGSFMGAVMEFSELNPTATLTDFLNSITLYADTDELGNEGTVSLATVHAVKGLEFKVVFLIGLDEQVFPLSRAMADEKETEEERRLMYVAVTRAQQKLCLCGAESRFLNGTRNYYMRSRFLREAAPVLGDKVGERTSFGPYGKGGSTYSAGGSYFGKSGGSNYGARRGGFGAEYRDNTYTSGGRTYTADVSEESEGVPKSAYYGKKQTAGTTEKKAPAFTTGCRVKHPKFGEGTVIEMKGEDASATVTVAFAGTGIKVLSAAIAPLTVVK